MKPFHLMNIIVNCFEKKPLVYLWSIEIYKVPFKIIFSIFVQFVFGKRTKCKKF